MNVMKKSMIAAGLALVVSAPAFGAGLPGIPSNHEVFHPEVKELKSKSGNSLGFGAVPEVHSDSSCSLKNADFEIKGLSAAMSMEEFDAWAKNNAGKNHKFFERRLDVVSSWEFDNFSIGGKKVDRVNMVAGAYSSDYGSWDRYSCSLSINVIFEEDIGKDMIKGLEKKFGVRYDHSYKNFQKAYALRNGSTASESVKVGDRNISIGMSGSYGTRLVENVDLNDF